ncbi:MAG: hypothetical protein H0V01_10300 [Bacteroidetes bacterium]|nr:hypothetical protein [Bacteroidota bacterium]HET6246051.1 hypothetical protein [Bacteroidia bacterium]
MKNILIILILLTIGCNQTETPFETDNIQFCNDSLVAEYFYPNDNEPTYDKKAIKRHFLQNYETQENLKSENGYLTISFIVNCKGHLGKYTVEQMGLDFKPYEFNFEITRQLLELTKQLDKWAVFTSEGIEYDHHRYLTFKIENGEITEITP